METAEMQFLTRGKGRLALVGVTILSVLAVALGTFLPVAFASGQGETREFTVDASRFSYSPNRLRINLVAYSPYGDYAAFLKKRGIQ